MFAVPLSSSGQQQQQQQQQQQGVEPSSSTSEWGTSSSIGNMASSGSSSSNLSTPGGGWGSSSPFQQQNGQQQAAAGSNGGSAGPSVTPVTDVTNKQPSSSNSNSSSEWMTSPSASASMVWQTSTAEPSGDNNNNGRNANPWNTPNSSSSSGFPTMNAKNNSLSNGNGNGNGNGSGNGGGAAQQYQATAVQPQDKENVNPSTPVSTERTPLDNMIYREGWGQVEVKQEVPWMVPESPPPIHDDPSVWKPKANTGTEVWEKSTGHRTQPWQNQAPNTPRWISGDEEPSSVWSSAGGAPGGPLGAGPSNSSSMMQQSAGTLSGGNNGGNGGGILSNGAMNASVIGSQGGRPAWTSSGSGDSSGGNISPSNQWNSDVQDQEWSEWRDPSSRGSKSEKADDGTSHWGGGMDRGSDRQAQMRDQQRNGMYNPTANSAGGMKKPEDRQRGWQDSPYGSSSSAMQSQGASEWSSSNGENEWSSGNNDKRSQQPPQWPTSSSSSLRDQHAQQRFSPPNTMAKHAREQIYQTKQYQGLLEMGFKREEIDVAMRNSMMNYEATLNELKRRRAQQHAQQMPMQQSSANSSSNAYGDGYKSGLTGMGSAASANSQAAGGQGQQSHLMQQQQQSHQDMNKAASANRAPAVPNIEALAHQLSVAARQGIISSRLLTQPLAPQTTYLLHKLMQSHRQMQNLSAQHEMLSKQHTPNPALQQQRLQQIVLAVNKIKSDISTLQKQIESVQNDFMRGSSSDPRFQSGPSLVDLTSSMPTTGAFPDFQNAASPQAAAWRMPNEHAAHYGAAAGDASSWMNAGMGSQFMGGGAAAAAAAFGMAPVAGTMWNAPNSQWAAMGHTASPGMGPYRQMAPSATSNVDDWTAHTNMMKSPSATTSSDHNVLSPTSRSGMSQNNMSAYGSDDTDGSHHWGGGRQSDTSSYAGGGGSNTFRFAAWDTLPEFVPGKPWQGSQLVSADEDPHMTPGSVAKSPLSLNATATGGASSTSASSGGNGGGNGNGGSGQRYSNDGSQ